MSAIPVASESRITGIAPQFLVDDIDQATAYYRDALGFEIDFVYESFYAGVSRNGISVHLKCAPKSVSDREHRQQNEHLDAYIDVTGIASLFEELQARGARILKTPERQPWGCTDFYVQDVDGYILCFGEQTAG